MYEYTRFINEWEKQSNAPQSDSKVVINEKWLDYINKQSVISATYKALQIPQFFEPKDLSKLRTWAAPTENTNKSILDLLEKREGGRKS